MRRLITLTLLVALFGCAQQPTGSTLYSRLGGHTGVDSIVYQLIVNIAADKRLVDRFKGVDIERFRQGLVTYICSVSNGDCSYQGESMQVVHAGHNYTDTEFNAIVENLILAMEDQRVPTATQNQLLARLAQDYRDVVYR
ncbi:group 1 truncated hemoglobin [Gilvimarinus sp. DA14]|uniref:group I truncated hemoglobin n=1 Tax=Gilvimarinus sp. DA14 TaxID=2956798 RepID=UPI0020B72EBF|nr:group 1 truncated hemoglobin [Gilvimarinus sp. DA14]UTF59191.1 group 1 truncated hemoglobin [Gilvimarinus sp. DA14]